MKKFYILLPLILVPFPTLGMEQPVDKPADKNIKLKITMYNYAHEAINRCPDLEPLITVIDQMNKTKKYGVTENIMGKYAYDAWTSSYESKNVPITLFFGYLKKYNQKIKVSKEALPTFDDLYIKKTFEVVNDPIAKMFNEYSCDNITYTKSKLDTINAPTKYPAFWALRSYTEQLHSHCNYANLEKFVHYIYSDIKSPTITNDYNNLPYKKLCKLFCKKACHSVNIHIYAIDFQAKVKNYIYDLLEIIEAGKKLSPQKGELDFGCNTIQSHQTKLHKVLIIEKNTKNKIAILCRLIKQYNDQRTTKITPTQEQVAMYNEYSTGFALPDTFNAQLFDKKVYAFEELATLSNNIFALSSTKEEIVQHHVEKFYLSKK